jgi:hypothetical protein
MSVLRQEADGMRVSGVTGEEVARIALEHQIVVTELYPLVANLEQAFFDLVGGAAS